ncbi:hypothetical protein LguiA_016384 [Lonicera macranthoides]
MAFLLPTCSTCLVVLELKSTQIGKALRWPSEPKLRRLAKRAEAEEKEESVVAAAVAVTTRSVGEGAGRCGLMLNEMLSLSENTCLLFLGTPPVNEAYIREVVGTNEDTRIYSEACREVCKDMKNVEFVDLFSAIQRHEDWLNTCFTREQNSDGEIEQVLKEAAWEPSLYRKDMSVKFGDKSPYGP